MRRLAYCTPVLDQLVVKGITTLACVLLGGGLVVQHSHHREAGEQAENGRRAGLHRNGQHRCDNDRARQCSQRALHPQRNPHATHQKSPGRAGAQRPASAFERTPIMTQEQKVIHAKLGLLELAKQLGNGSKACKMMGYSRDSFYRVKELYETGGELALQELTRTKPLLANRTAPEIEGRILELSPEQPAFGQIRIANEIRARGRSISPLCLGVSDFDPLLGGVGPRRHDLETRRSASKRLAAQGRWCFRKTRCRPSLTPSRSPGRK